VQWATFQSATQTGTVQMGGGVETKAHPIGDVHALETSFWNPRLEIDGDDGTLYVDLTYRPFVSVAPNPIPSVQSAIDVAFADVDLSGVNWTPDANGNYRIDNAPMTGIAAAMELIGWDDFYGTNVVLDPLSITFNPTTFAPALAPSPKVVVSQTENLRPGDTVVVWGSGFDPATNIGTRPPLPGQPAGVYAVFGRFADTWKPSAGAPSSSRTILAQRWALPAAQHLALDPAQTNPSFIRLDAFGRFKTLLTVTAGGTSGNYGVYTFPGAGAVNTAHEIAVPVELITS
jgi:hypothetical protein